MKVTCQIKTASTRIGCTTETYLKNRAKGLAWCSRCKAWKPKSRQKCLCQKCSNEYSRNRYAASGRPRRQSNQPADNRWLIVGGDAFVYGTFAKKKDAEDEAQRLRTHLDNPPVIEVRPLVRR